MMTTKTITNGLTIAVVAMGIVCGTAIPARGQDPEITVSSVTESYAGQWAALPAMHDGAYGGGSAYNRLWRSGSPVILTFDLGETMQLSSFAISSGWEYCGTGIDKVEISTSLDDITYSGITTFDDFFIGASTWDWKQSIITWESTDAEWIATPLVDGRYVKVALTNTSDPDMQVSEVDFYGVAPPPATPGTLIYGK